MEMNTEEDEIATKHRQELLRSGLRGIPALGSRRTDGFERQMGSEFFRHGIALVELWSPKRSTSTRVQSESMAVSQSLMHLMLKSRWECPL